MTIPGVGHIETNTVLQPWKSNTALPLK